LRSFLALALLFAVGPARASSEASLVLPAEATVEGPEITLGEIGRFEGLDPEQVELLSGLSLGRAAAPSRQRVFSGSALRRRILDLDPELRVEVASEIRVHTAYREITPEFVRSHLEKAIRHKMPWSDATVSFSHWRLPERFPVPTSAHRVVVHFRAEETFLRRVHAEIELVTPGAKLPRIRRSGSVNLSVRVPVVVTAVDLRRGALLRPDNLELKVRDLGGLPRNVVRDLDHATGLQLDRGLPAATPLVPGYLRHEPLVKRGDFVSVRAGGLGLSVRLEARALEAGALGEMIRFENPRTRHRFRAEITGPGAARLTMPNVGSGP
jgi:flagella basal body P-ring formation protein FlgA